jgi:hypothetical protein
LKVDELPKYEMETGQHETVTAGASLGEAPAYVQPSVYQQRNSNTNT